MSRYSSREDAEIDLEEATFVYSHVDEFISDLIPTGEVWLYLTFWCHLCSTALPGLPLKVRVGVVDIKGGLRAKETCVCGTQIFSSTETFLKMDTLLRLTGAMSVGLQCLAFEEMVTVGMRNMGGRLGKESIWVFFPDGSERHWDPDES